MLEVIMNFYNWLFRRKENVNPIGPTGPQSFVFPFRMPKVDKPRQQTVKWTKARAKRKRLRAMQKASRRINRMAA